MINKKGENIVATTIWDQFDTFVYGENPINYGVVLDNEGKALVVTIKTNIREGAEESEFTVEKIDLIPTGAIEKDTYDMPDTAKLALNAVLIALGVFDSVNWIDKKMLIKGILK